MKKLLVHVHVFYTEQWPALYARLASACGGADDLWVTHCGTTPGFSEQVQRDAPAAHVLQVRNVGYDVGPFVEVLKRVNLDAYSFCIKIHSKRDLPEDSMLGGFDVGGSIWREWLLSFLEPQHFARCMQAFEREPALGMVGHHALIWRREPADKKAWRQAVQWLEAAGLPYSAPAYVAGSMFICRAALLAPLIDMLGDVEFEAANQEGVGTLAHAAERLLGFVVAAQGYEVNDVYSSAQARRADRMRGIRRRVARFLYQRKVTRKGKLIIKICRIPIYRSRIK